MGEPPAHATRVGIPPTVVRRLPDTRSVDARPKCVGTDALAVANAREPTDPREPAHWPMDTTYHLDNSDRIVGVNADWIAFAIANGAPDLPGRVLGRAVWQFISNRTVRELYRTLFRRVRETRAPMTVTFRCDSPDVRRIMSLTVESDAESADVLACHASLLHEEPHAPSVRTFAALRSFGASTDVAAGSDGQAPSRQLNATGPRRAEPLLSMCSWCKRVNVSGWREIEDALVVDPSLFTEPVRPITHGICPACAERVRATLV
jgi:hypothetical protein